MTYVGDTSLPNMFLIVQVAGALLEKRIPIADKDKHGFTPLMYAALKHQSVTLAKFLIGWCPLFQDVSF